MTDEEIKLMIQKHEGYRDRVYIDSVGVPTVGFGHALHVGSKISHKLAELLFEQDFHGVLQDYEILIKNNRISVDGVRRAVLIDMLFNMGLIKLSKFKKMLRAIREKRYNDAAWHMLDSKYARQVGYRAKKLAKMLKTGEVDV